MMLLVATTVALASPVLLVLETGSPVPDDAELQKFLGKQGVAAPRVHPLADLLSDPDSADRNAIGTAIQGTETLSWDAQSEQEWGQSAHQLLDLVKPMVAATAEDTALLFRAYAQIGYCAENANNATPPFYGKIGGTVVNVYWHRAGALAHQDPSLLAKGGNADVRASIDHYKGQVATGTIPPTMLSFNSGGPFSVKAFSRRYQVFLNGYEILVEDAKGLYPAPLGMNVVRLDDTRGTVLLRRFESRKAGVQQVLDARPFRSDLLAGLAGVKKCEPIAVDADVDKALGAWTAKQGAKSSYIAFPPPGKTSKTVVLRYQNGSLVKTSCL